MRLAVRRMDQSGQITNLQIDLEPLRFLKCLALAGHAFAPDRETEARAVGAVLWFGDYLDSAAFAASRFSEPPTIRAEPTGKAQFSNIAGKGLADFLVRELDGGVVTFNYEAALRLANLPIAGERPDLLCVTRKGLFLALEAKGYAKRTVSDPEMAVHKAQSQQGAITVQSSVASVAYNLYSDVNVKYYDPVMTNGLPDSRLLYSIVRHYYTGLLQLSRRVPQAELDLGLLGIDGIPISVPMSDPFLGILDRREPLTRYPFQLFLDGRGILAAESGTLPEIETISTSTTFLDTDGIGVVRLPLSM